MDSRHRSNSASSSYSPSTSPSDFVPISSSPKKGSSSRPPGSFQHGAAPQVAEQRPLSDHSYMDNLGSYFQDFSYYIPTGLKQKLAGGHSSGMIKEEKDTILSTSFDSVELPNGEHHHCLIIGHTNGFQIWDIEESNRIQEILSKREGPIQCVKVLPTPEKAETEESPLYGKRPLVAVASGSDSSSFPHTMVKLFSLKTNEYVNMLRFRTEVHSVLCSKQILVVALKDHLYGFDAVTMEKVMTLNCYPNPLQHGVVALGARWIAYAGNQPLSTMRQPSASDKFVEVAKDVASNLYSFGQKKFSEYMYPGESVSQSKARSGYDTDLENAGTVIIYDVVKKTTISHFQAHSQPLSALIFDPSGTLLVTSSIEGHNFHVFRITPNSAGGVQTNFRHLYKLQRGLTNATIQDMSFSYDSRWIAVSSTRGTTHIFAINPTGGPVGVHTHLRLGNSTLNAQASMYAFRSQNGPISLSACNRIKQGVFEESKGSHLPPIASTSAFLGYPYATERVYVVNQVGVLTQYQLIPHKPEEGSVEDPNTLQLNVEALIEWDVCRRTKWPEIPFSSPPETEKKVNQNQKESESSIKWLANVEICSHDPNLRRLWASPQFTFKTFQAGKNDVNPASHLFHEEIPTHTVEVRRNDPAPFREGAVSEHPVSRDVYASGIFTDIVAPSAPPLSDDLMKETISAAMNSRMEYKDFDTRDIFD